MIPFIQAFHIVVADDVQSAGKRFRSFLPQEFPFVSRVLGLVLSLCQAVIQPAPVGADSVAHRPCSVQPADGIRQPRSQQVSVVQASAFRYLIPRGPDNHAGMGPVPPDKCRQVLFPAFREELAVVPAPLRDSPGVKCFVKHIHSQPVACLNQRGGRRVVGGPDGIEAFFLQFPHFPGFRFIQGYGSQQSVVVVQASTLQLHRFSVDLQSPPGVGCNRPDSE